MTSQVTAIRLLGRLSIDRDGVASATAFPGRRSELVFAYLTAEHRRDVSRDELADALWPQELPDAWAAALRGVVSDVRRVIAGAGLDAGAVLERTGGGYRLRLPPGAVVDLDEARVAVPAARARLEAEPAAAAADATRAAELARQPFLPRHEGDWVEGVRRELETLLVEALELAARGHARAGDARAAAAAAARLVEVEPYSEPAHRLRIEVLAEVGDRTGAARAYEQCRATFAAELGVEPSAETQAALARALETAPPIAAATPAPPAASPLAALSVLVVDDHDFQRRTATALLGRLGVGSLAEARDGTDALDLLARSAPPDVIVCDIDMPGMDGVEFIRHVAERRFASAVVIASGLERKVLQAVEAIGEGYGLQVLGAVEKPLTARRLAELLGGYRRPLAERSDDAATTDAELRSALAEGRIAVRFAPIVDLQGGAVAAADAVATWQDDSGRAHRVVGEQVSGELAAQLTDHVLAAGCEQLAAMTGAGMDVDLWLGTSGDMLGDVARVDRLLAIVRERAVEPRRIVWAVGERAVRRSTPAELDVLTRLRVKGFGLCLDGFGGGHVSDDALARLPLTAVALAPALVSGAGYDDTRAGALEDALDAIRALGVPAVARGCDDASDYELLLQAGCGYAQGAFIAGTLPGDELTGWARAWSAPTIGETPG